MTLALLQRATKLTTEQIRKLPERKRREIEDALATWIRQDAQANQLVYYRVANPDALTVHRSIARQVGIQGGNKSGKTATMLAEAAIQMTGVVPISLAVCAICYGSMERRLGGWDHVRVPDRAHAAQLLYPVAKLRGPIRVRLVVTSNINAWDENLKRKLQYFEWNGRVNEHGLPGDPRYGHWGFIPRRFLLNGDWEQSWSERHRKLTLNLHGDGGVTPGSTLTVMSHEQKLEDFNQGSFHLVVEDEIPPEDIHRANRLRMLEVRGQLLVGGTPPDEDRPTAVAAGWFFDQILAPGLSGSNPDEVEAVALWTEHNRTLEAQEVDKIAQGLTPDERRARLHGESLHLSGLIIRGFTEKPKVWCFGCNAELPLGVAQCSACGSRDVLPYSHVWTDDDLAWPGPPEWPTLFYFDPHQARPAACLWIRLDPNDAAWVVAECEIEGDAEMVKREVEEVERRSHLHPVFRKGDPKITAQTNQYARQFQGQPFSIRRAFEDVGFWFEDANTNFTVGIERLERRLRPNPLTRAPGLRVWHECRKTIYQTTHFTWDGEKPGRKNSDFPAALRYFAIDELSSRGLAAVRAGTLVQVATGMGTRNARTGW